MSGQVDVLAFFDDCIHYLDAQDNLAGYEVEQAGAARTAVARLIEACEMLQKHPGDSEVQAEFCNALARAKGGSA